MRKSSLAAVAALLTALAVPVGAGVVGGGTGTAAPSRHPTAAAAVADLPVTFVENHGQLDGPVTHYTTGGKTSVYFGRGGLTYALRQNDGSRWAVKVDFLGAGDVVPVTRERAPGTVSWFAGPSQRRRAGVPTASSLVYRDLWPGIDLVATGRRGGLEYDFVVRPGADPALVRLAYRGATTVAAAPDGGRRGDTPAGGVSERAPRTYPEVDGRRVEVTSAFVVRAGAEAGTWETGIPVGDYDHDRPLVIDPVVLVSSGYFGGADVDTDVSMTLDAAGDVYLVGSTNSREDTFPVAVGPDLTHTGTLDRDVFVAKLRGNGTGVVYAGYLGGTGYEWSRGIAVDAGGNAYVTGVTNSTEASFPVTVGPDLTFNGVNDAFVAKVAADGSRLVYAGYIGGVGGDSGQGIKVDADGSAVVVGPTDSPQTSFPAGGGGDLTFGAGGGDGFVAKVRPDGTALLHAGYLGGAGSDAAADLALDAAGDIVVVGQAASPETTGFPVVGGPDLTYNNEGTSGSDGFLGRLRGSDGAIVNLGYIGGTGFDQALDVAVDATGAAYVVGNTSSPPRSFPISKKGADRNRGGGFFVDGFLVKVAPGGTGIVYGTYIGSDTLDNAGVVAIDATGAAYVAGFVGITAKFPTPDGFDTSHNGATDAFVVKVNPAGSAFVWGTFLGGAEGEGIGGMGLDPSGDIVVAGGTLSTEATFPVVGPGDLTANGGGDAFVARLRQTA